MSDDEQLEPWQEPSQEPWIDVSVPIRAGMPHWPRDPPVQLSRPRDLAAGDEVTVSRLDLGAHTGTHVDAAKHFFDNGQTVDQIPLDRLVGPAILIAVDENLMSVAARDLESHDLKGHKRVLIRTRNSGFLLEHHFHRDYTFLAPDGAEYLVSLGVELVGVDYLSIEQFHSGHHKTHRILLDKQVVIVEGLHLWGPQPGEYEFCCLPLRLEGLDGAPARAILIER